MPVVNCPIDIPEGWEFVRYGVPSSGETFLNEDGDPDSSDPMHLAVVIRKIKDTAPDPGEGYRRAEGDDWKDERCEIWEQYPSYGRWGDRLFPGEPFSAGDHYRIPIDPAPKHPPVPEGWRELSSDEVVAAGDKLPYRGQWHNVIADIGVEQRLFDYPHIRRACPAIEVGDWARVDCEGSTLHGRIGKVSTGTSMDGSLMVRFSGGVARWIKPEDLRKQSRFVEPYTIDQCIAEAAKRGRHVQCGSKSTLIESIHIAGVTLSCPSIGFVSYVDATSQLTWSGGEAFGIETVTWRDAE